MLRTVRSIKGKFGQIMGKIRKNINKKKYIKRGKVLIKINEIKR